ncbi:MAG: response regulator [Caldilineaceae bacterium]|nr:response regulator [Caldilineaceae bacterium]
MTMGDESVHILLVEDDEVDAEAIVRAFQRQKVPHPITIVTDGFEALQVLRGQAGPPRLQTPYLILLDLNMPRMNGLEFLQIIRKDPELMCSVVFVLTTSDSDQDKLAAYNAQIAGYFLKQRTGDNFSNLINLLSMYWRIIEFPPKE